MQSRVSPQQKKHAKLLKAWNDAASTVSALCTELRLVPGCRDAVITICIRNGARMDTFSVPYDSPLPGLYSPSSSQLNFDSENPSRSWQQNNGHSLQPTVQEPDGQKELDADNRLIDHIMSEISKMNSKDFRAFLSNLRKRLHLNSFKWPENAKSKYVSSTGEAVPTRPGRANSGMGSLRKMLKLSMETDRAWRLTARRALMDFGLLSTPHLEHGRNADSHINPNYHSESSHRGENNINEHNEENDCHEPSFNSENSDDPDVPDDPNETHREITAHSKTLPVDSMKTSTPKHSWASVHQLVSSLTYPQTVYDCEWFIQDVPGDGNCLFYSVLIAAKNKYRLPTNVTSVSDLRSFLRYHLESLAEAGRPNSLYRRNWLASCMHDIDDEQLRNYCAGGMVYALQTRAISDIEAFLSPLRVYVGNWAKMVGTTHWGGLLTVELSLICTIVQAVIEVLQENILGNPVQNDPDTVQACDTRSSNRLTKLYRRALHYPMHCSLPSSSQHFLASNIGYSTHSGWVGPHPVLRLTLRDRHYNVCTSKHTNFIPPSRDAASHFPQSRWFSNKDNLVEPYASLNDKENQYYEKAKLAIETWRLAAQNSEAEGHHADEIVMQAKSTELTVSNLSLLQAPPPIIVDKTEFMISDEIMTCYMSLLEKRANQVNNKAITTYTEKPPRCHYLDSWFYKSISRGLKGPSSRRQRTDLAPFSMLMIPALVENHWVLVFCNLEESTIGVYDPLKSRREDVFAVVKSWAEMQLRTKVSKIWKFLDLQEASGNQQIGDIDCGVYVCKAAESLGLGLPIHISDWDIEYVRKRMLMELFRREATSIKWPRT